MDDDVAFAMVLEFLREHGYELVKRRKYPGEDTAGFVIFGRPGSPNIGFPVRNRKVAYEHYETLVRGLEGGGEPPEEAED